MHSTTVILMANSLSFHHCLNLFFALVMYILFLQTGYKESLVLIQACLSVVMVYNVVLMSFYNIPLSVVLIWACFFVVLSATKNWHILYG